jgi:hypothetical protein
MNFTRARAGALVGLLGLTASAAFVACGGDDTSPATTADAGKDTNVPDTNPGVDSSPPPDAGGDTGDTTTLYQRLGGHTGIKTFVSAVVTQLLKDPEEASYFVLNVPTPYPNRAAADDIIECFTDLAGSATGGPETYPVKLASGYQCRSMAETHKGVLADGGVGATDINFHIPNGVFTKFVVTAAAVATAAGVPAADIGKVGALLNTTKGDIVDPDAGDGGFFNALPYCDAGDNRPGCYPADASQDAPDAG